MILYNLFMGPSKQKAGIRSLMTSGQNSFLENRDFMSA